MMTCFVLILNINIPQVSPMASEINNHSFSDILNNYFRYLEKKTYFGYQIGY